MMHMYVKCVAVVAALAMVAVGTSALTEEERGSEIAKLMAQLNALKEAEAAEAAAAAAEAAATAAATANAADARVRGFPHLLRAPAALP